MRKRTFPALLFFALYNLCFAQNVPILDYSLNNFGQVQLEIEAQADKYYLLTAMHEPNLQYESIVSMTIGLDGTMTISEPLAGFLLQNYRITEHSIANPDDTDGDGIDDISEFNNMPDQAPLNFAREVERIDGSTSITSHDIYSELAVVSENIPWAPFLNNQEFVKFAIINHDTDNPEVYFINSKTHDIHASFLSDFEVDQYGGDVATGEIVYNPNAILPNGALGSYSINYSFGDAEPFEYTRRTFELIARNMPYLNNNLLHFIGDSGENLYLNNYQNAYVGSRVPVVLESEFFADVDFLPFNQTEGFGFFRQMTLDENPGSRDIVLYDALPNSLPRVGGIITSVVQTPLSHVNLRAIQDNVPNAYIKNPLEIDSIANLLEKYVYYKVEQDRYEIREASLEEVNEWFEKLRPTEEQIPDRDLSQTRILPLDSIGFEMSTAFGAKCSNVATMRRFGFPEGTIPNGFGVPFYFYDEFMKFNGFYDEVEEMITDPEFISDLETRIDMLKDFRKDIKAADMPEWMLDELQAMHDWFPEGTSVRCRSSTNNEDLPGFSGAGLYTSKTQHPEEGHISKSIKQVYASIWNFRAFDERDFYRVDHYVAAMGVLCHPNFEEEKSNGVGVSIDPIYQTEGNFYLNTQVGESLITNPEANTIPEEILLNEDPDEGYFVLRRSNLVAIGELVMDEEYLDLMREYLKVIHDEFEILYNVVGAEGFGMDIEYKVTRDDQLIIKQARPWVSFWADIKSNFDLGVSEIIEPRNASTLGESELVTAKIVNQGLENMKDFDISLTIDGQLVETLSINEELGPQNSTEYQFTIPQDFSVIGDYNVMTVVSHPSDGYDRNDTLNTVISNLHLLEGGLTSVVGNAKCGNEVELRATVYNYGEVTFSETMIEVVSNGVVVDTFVYDFNIPYATEVEMRITVTENLTEVENEIMLNLISVNGEADAIVDNNSLTFSTDLSTTFDDVSLILNPDQYPQENSWQILDANNEVVASGTYDSGVTTESVCLNYSACNTIVVLDSYGDGIFNGGGFVIVNSNGDTLVVNTGEFGSHVEEAFCPSGEEDCLLIAEVIVDNASSEFESDGSITISSSDGIAPYEFSIDGGQNFGSNQFIGGLAPGVYEVVVADASEDCIYEETVEVEFDIVDGVSDLLKGKIKIFPNPTEGNFEIELDNSVRITSELNIEIYDNLGRLVQHTSIPESDIKSNITIYSESFAKGSYVAKIYNLDFEKYFKVIKL